MKVPNLSRPQVIASAKLARALRIFLQTHGVVVPVNHEVAIGEGELNTDTRTLTIKYDFFEQQQWYEDEI